MRIPRHRRQGLNILRSRYVLAHKHSGTDEQYAKDRLVVQVIRRLDRDYASLLIFSPTLAKASSRL